MQMGQDGKQDKPARSWEPLRQGRRNPEPSLPPVAPWGTITGCGQFNPWQFAIGGCLIKPTKRPQIRGARK